MAAGVLQSQCIRIWEIGCNMEMELGWQPHQTICCYGWDDAILFKNNAVGHGITELISNERPFSFLPESVSGINRAVDLASYKVIKEILLPIKT
jgi:hypothetical protein